MGSVITVISLVDTLSSSEVAMNLVVDSSIGISVFRILTGFLSGQKVGEKVEMRAVHSAVPFFYGSGQGSRVSFDSFYCNEARKARSSGHRDAHRLHEWSRQIPKKRFWAPI